MRIKTYYAKKAKYYDAVNAYKFRETNEELKFFKRIFKKFNKKIKRILDVCCGTGRFSIPLGEMGYKVVGIDISKEMLNVAKKKVKKNNKNVALKLVDMRTYKSKNKFDCVVCGDSSLAHLLTKKEVVKALRNFHRHLNRNGIFFYDVWNYIDYRNWKPTDIWTETKGDIKISIIRKNKIDSKGLYRWADDIHVKEGNESFKLKINSKIKLWKFGEWIKMFKDAGFGTIESYTNLKHVKSHKGIPERYYFVAVK